VTISADQALQATDAQGGSDRSAATEAEDFLRSYLADGRKPAKEVQAAARDSMISIATLRRAKAAVGVEVSREGFGPGGTVMWALSAHRCSSPPIGAHPRNVSTYGKNEHLWRNDPPAPPPATPEPAPADDPWHIPPAPDRRPALGPPGDSSDDFK